MSDKREIRKKRSKRDNGDLWHVGCALHRDSLNGDLFSIDKAIASQVNVDETNPMGTTALHFAAQNGHTDVAIKLLDAGANPSPCNKNNETPLHLAVRKGFDEIVYHLLRNKAEVDTVNTQEQATALYYAVCKGYSECVRLLVRAGADPHHVTASGSSIAQEACNGNNVETLRQITEVINVNAPIQGGRTALHWACYYGKMAFVRQLISNGASVHVRDEEGCTPLFWAVYSGHANVVRHLLRHGADSQAHASDGSQPLHWAATYNHPTVTEILLTDDCDVNATYSFGMTSLHHAADLGFDQIVTVLIAHGANVGARVEGRTALDMASSKEHKRVIELLANAGALTAKRKEQSVGLDTLSTEEVAGFLSVKHLAMFIEKFVDLQLDGAKVAEIFRNESNAKVFLQSINADTVERFKVLCQRGMYNITDSKRGNYARAVQHYEEKLTAAVHNALEHGVDHDEINDEAFALTMERAYEARRIFHKVDVDNSGGLDVHEVASLAEQLGFNKKAADMYLQEFDADGDGVVDVEEFVQFFNTMKSPDKAARKKLKKRASKAEKKKAKRSSSTMASGPAAHVTGSPSNQQQEQGGGPESKGETKTKEEDRLPPIGR